MKANGALARLAEDEVNSPAHYNAGSIECIQAIEAMLGDDGALAYCRGNALKYLWRCLYKNNTKQDIEKAVWYINRCLLYVDKIPTSVKEQNSGAARDWDSSLPPAALRRELMCAACGSYTVCGKDCPTPRSDRTWQRSHTTPAEEALVPNADPTKK